MASSATEDALARQLAERSDREIAILRAAYDVMARAGSNRLNLQDIADRAGVSKGLVLYHFHTRNAVLQHAMQWALLQTAQRIRASLAATEDPADEAALLMRVVIDGTFLQWLQRPDWRDCHAEFRDRCHATLRTLLTPP